MRMLYLSRGIIINFSFLICLPVIATAQPAKIPFHRESYFVHSGLHNGQEGTEAETYEAFREVIWVPGAPWLRLRFQAYSLEEKGEYQ